MCRCTLIIHTLDRILPWPHQQSSQENKFTCGKQISFVSFKERGSIARRGVSVTTGHQRESISPVKWNSGCRYLLNDNGPRQCGPTEYMRHQFATHPQGGRLNGDPFLPCVPLSGNFQPRPSIIAISGRRRYFGFGSRDCRTWLVGTKYKLLRVRLARLWKILLTGWNHSILFQTGEHFK